MASLLNIGSLCVDYVYQVPSLAGAGETIASRQREVFAGGKGLNQSVAAAKAGCDVTHFGVIGLDGEALVRTLRDNGVNTEHILRGDTASGHAFIQVDPRGQNAIVIHGGSNRTLDPPYWQAAVASAAPGDWLLLQNETNAIADIIEYASDLEVSVAINLAPADESVRELPLTKVDLLIVNEAEACVLADAHDSNQAFSGLCESFPDLDIIMTLGSDGLRYRYQEGLGSLPAFVVDAIDETAAGDAFVGYLMAHLVNGSTLEQAASSGSAAGALAVTRAGAAPSIPASSEVDEFLRTHTLRV